MEHAEVYVSAALTLLASLMMLSVQRQLRRLDGHDSRLRELEVRVPTLATKADVDAVRQDVSGQIATLRADVRGDIRREVDRLVDLLRVMRGEQ